MNKRSAGSILFFGHTGVFAAERHQLTVRTAFQNAAVFQIKNFIGIPQSGNSLRNQYAGFSLHDGMQILQDPLFGVDVDGTEYVVENHNFRFANERPCDHNALFLSA